MADFGAGEVPVGTAGPITGGKDGEPLRRVIRGPTRAYSMPPGPGGAGGAAGGGGANYDGRSLLLQHALLQPVAQGRWTAHSS